MSKRVLAVTFLMVVAACGAACSPQARQPAGKVALNWVPPAEYEDGSRLSELAGYRLYWGQSKYGPYRYSAWIDDPERTSRRIEGLSDGDWYFVITAVTADNVESRLSNVERITIEDGVGRLTTLRDGARMSAAD